MTAQRKPRRSDTHAIVYRGAPYDLNEGGHVVSYHHSEDAAYARLNRYASETVVTLDDAYLDGDTAREYFSR